MEQRSGEHSGPGFRFSLVILVVGDLGVIINNIGLHQPDYTSQTQPQPLTLTLSLSLSLSLARSLALSLSLLHIL
jgi:hypothetical protein